MQLAYGFTFTDLYARDGLVSLDARFVAALAADDASLHARMMVGRAAPGALAAKEHSQLIIDLAPRLEDFLTELFGNRAETAALKARHFALAPLYACKRLFVQRRAAKAFKEEEGAAFNGGALEAAMAKFLTPAPGMAYDILFARHVLAWLDAPEAHAEALEVAARFAAWALYHPEGKARFRDSVLFRQPRKRDPHQLITAETEVRNGVTMLKAAHGRERRGFALTDPGVTLAAALDEAHYCIWCHNQDKDSCSKGLKEKDGSFKTSVLDITLAGCPLEEKISEMQFLKSEGVPVGALAAIVIDNPMCAGTGHRICNDCMKSCIYQKQDPVNIPEVETRTLLDVLELPYGFEIYSLLTRWNPLNLHRPLPRPASGKAVLVVGLGPAGYTLAHHLMNDGHTVMGIDGLKLEPLPADINGVRAGGRAAFVPIRDIASLKEPLETRTLAGFGGVAEYGITVRWDKNFLKMLRLLLERREECALLGGVRFGSNITFESAWELGFDHIALCMGAGRPTVLSIPNALARGVRTASDFLMALQLTGAGKADTIANLQMRLPVVVIGGGLTAIDTATEALAYYPVQVEKFLARYEILTRERGEEAVRRGWNGEEREIAEEFLSHARAIRAERQKPVPDVPGLLRDWGGAVLCYRKRLIDAPSYRLNHEEVEKALEEHIRIAEELEPVAIEVDGYSHACAVTFRKAHADDGPTVTLPARTVLVAAGTHPNTVLAREAPEQVTLHGKYFRAVDEDGVPVTPERSSKPGQAHVLLAREADGRAVSFFGDLHPSFAGNVVKAMASAKQGYPVVTRALGARKTPGHRPAFLSDVRDALQARVHAVRRLTPTIVEIIVHAPLAARAFRPGQFYRLQNFEANALKTETPDVATRLTMEGLAMTGAWVDMEKGLVSMIALEMGGSSDLCAFLAPGEPVVLMGPTGTATEIPDGGTAILIGGGLGNAVLFSIGKAMREKGVKVLYFAGYKQPEDRYKTEEIEAAADVVVWCCDTRALAPNRPQDKSFRGNIVQAMVAYAMGEWGPPPVLMKDADLLIAIGSDKMMAAVGAARCEILLPYLKPGHKALGSINSPMQCMMKEICAQCIQQHVDPMTGQTRYVYSCTNQDQPLDHVAFPFLNERLRQNGAQEKLTALWIDRSLRQLKRRA